MQVGESFTLPLPPLESGSLRVSRHLSGRAYPVLDCAGVECGRRASAVRRVSGANLEVERFVEKAKWLFRKISRPEHRSSLKSWFGAQTGESFTLPLPPLESGSLRASRHLSGWAYPLLDCAGVKCGRRASAVRRVSRANLKVERLSFSSISRPEHRSSSKSWFGAQFGG